MKWTTVLIVAGFVVMALILLNAINGIFKSIGNAEDSLSNTIKTVTGAPAAVISGLFNAGADAATGGASDLMEGLNFMNGSG